MVTARNRFRMNRLWLALLAVVLGIVAGFYVGRESILYLVKSRVNDYSDRVMQREEEIGAEISTTLAQANASEFPPCSIADLLLRRLSHNHIPESRGWTKANSSARRLQESYRKNCHY